MENLPHFNISKTESELFKNKSLLFYAHIQEKGCGKMKKYFVGISMAIIYIAAFAAYLFPYIMNALY